MLTAKTPWLLLSMVGKVSGMIIDINIYVLLGVEVSATTPPNLHVQRWARKCGRARSG